ncbi:hypothetical protein [Ornithinimicrobium avium]|uniref:Uncharacterized protein n=1 Tax=Ornithinimicrobium avium TaxID=2283195 RepID=A0A345NNV9_9MICO|nr:hypothetical protein [Ornithinimicrobium avium]AXH96717.1 hypothetical protein DV701_11845 [Ornithinimicrobium avium]
MRAAGAVSDPGALADQAPNVEMFDVAVADDEIVVVTLTCKESDGQNLADQEAAAAAASAAVLGAVTLLFPPAAVITDGALYNTVAARAKAVGL